MPKLYFYDTSLACHLLRLTSAEDVYDHYLRGGLFESLVISDLLKKRFNRALPPNAYFWRDKTGHEVDCLLEEGSHITPIEIKSGATIQSDMFEGLDYWSALAGKNKGLVVYGGTEEQKRSSGHVLSWQKL